MKGDIAQIVRWIIAALVLVAALAGIYELGHVTNEPQLFPILVGLAVLLGLIRYAFRWLGRFFGWLRERLRRLAEYPRLVRQVEAFAPEKKALEEQVKTLQRDGLKSYKAGMVEAKRQVVGAVLAAGLEHMPSMVSIAMASNRLQITCRRNGDKTIPINSRFYVVVDGSKQRLGVLAVMSVAPDGPMLTLEPVEETDPAFWEGLRARADADHSAPGGVSLEKYQLNLFEEEAPAPQQPATQLEEGE